MPPSPHPRVAAVSYLNTAPLVWGMLHGPQRDLFDVSFCLPSECADRVRDGIADIGIVPVVEVARQNLTVIPGTGIACRGPVRSILLISKVPFSRIRTLATDLGSRTSVVLAQIVLRRKFDADPTLVSMPPDMDLMLAAADAALIIGDAALAIDPAAIPYPSLDLGAEWLELTGLPMVFAVWAGPKQFCTPEAARGFSGSCRYGLEHMDEIVARESAGRNLPPSLVRDYFARNVVLELDDQDYDGMRAYLSYAAELERVSA